MRRDEYATMFRVEATHWWYRALHRLIFQTLETELPDWRQKQVLDAGCGTGAILERLGNPAKNFGVDLAPEAIAFCQERGLENVRQADICDLPFTDDSFDAVICSSVIYHEWVANVGTAMHEMCRVLRPGGLLILNVPAFRFLHSAHDEAVMTARRFRKSEVRRLLVDHNFTIRRLTYWTTVLFPLAVIARTIGLSQMGRDFEVEHESFQQRVFTRIMNFELRLLRRTSLPFGVALLAVADKQETA